MNITHAVMAVVIISGCFGVTWLEHNRVSMTSINKFDGVDSRSVASLDDCVNKSIELGKRSGKEEWFSCKQVLSDKITFIVVGKVENK